MKFTVITVCFNSASTILDCVNSVASQSDVEMEYIIVDGGSTDGTVEIINQFMRMTNRSVTFISERDSGIYDAMNKGLSLATGDIIGFLNSDDVYADSFVLKAIHEKILIEDSDGCYGDLVYVDSLDLTKIQRFWKSGKMPELKMQFGWHPAHPTFYIKKILIQEGFNLNYRIASDYEFMLRIIMKQNLNLSYLPKILVKMRVGGISNRSFSSIYRANKECYRAWKENGIKASPFLIPGKIIWKLKQRIFGAFCEIAV